MKNNGLFELIGLADEKYVAEAKKKPKENRRVWLVSAVAALLAASLMLGFAMMVNTPPPPPHIPDDTTQNGGPPEATTTPTTPAPDINELPSYTPPTGNPSILYPPGTLERYRLLGAVYPSMLQFPKPETGEGWKEWRADQNKFKEDFNNLEKLPEEFLKKSIAEFLSSSKDGNTVYSPLNVYMALAMLAEISEGNSRRQILDILGVDSIEELRAQANAIWRASYRDDGIVNSVLASSLWMDNDIAYKEEVLQKLAEIYYSSSFCGEMGSEEYNDSLRAWLNEQTGGMLSNQIEKLEMSPETVFAIATTVYFKASWESIFYEENNDRRIFYGASGMTSCEFMNTYDSGLYFWGENFSATRSTFACGGSMYFILPETGVSVDELLSDPEAMSFITSKNRAVWEKQSAVFVNLSVPKFDVSSELDLIEGLKNLGLTDVFDYSKADFSALTDKKDLAITTATHGARVMIDETGCIASACTLFFGAEGGIAQDEVDFVLDRPFIFVIASETGLPLFVGIVNNLQ